MRLQHAAPMIGLLVSASTFFSVAAQKHSGLWRRVVNAPILSSQARWESAGTFHLTVVMHGGKYVMLYRAQDAAGTSRLGDPVLSL